MDSIRKTFWQEHEIFPRMKERIMLSHILMENPNIEIRELKPWFADSLLILNEWKKEKEESLYVESFH
jgi:hypothetical protein